MLNESGAVTKTYDYEAYGNELSRDHNDANPFRYCGEYYDTETGFIYLRARYYDLAIGRFISVDPAKDGLNWYAYCNDNPLNYVDSSGLSAIKCMVNSYLRFHNKYMLRTMHDIPWYTVRTSFAQAQLERNRYQKPERHNQFKYINDQQITLGTGGNYDYGACKAEDNACEVIAVYNALYYLEEPRYL